MAIGSDEKTRVTEVVTEYLQNKGIEVEPHGPLTGRPMDWADVARAVGERVASGAADPRTDRAAARPTRGLAGRKRYKADQVVQGEGLVGSRRFRQPGLAGGRSRGSSSGSLRALG